MEEKKTYLVTCEVEVKASSEKEAEQEAIEYMKELISFGNIQVHVEALS